MQPTTEKKVAPTPPPSNGQAVVEKERAKRETIIVSADGKISKFDRVGDAEKFLNSPDAPAQFRVFKGVEVTRKQKVSLR